MTSRTSRALLASLFLFSVVPVAGCNILAPIVFLVAGPDKIEAMHTLEKQRSVVVFIEDPRNQMPRRALRIAVLEAVEDELLNRDLVETVISGQSAMRLADNDPSAGGMSVTEIGRAVGADVVIWVTIDSFARVDMTRNVQPSVGMRVRVIDAAENAAVFPANAQAAPNGQPVFVQDSVRRGTVASASGAQSAAELKIADKAGRAIAQLFYKHVVTEHIAERGL